METKPTYQSKDGDLLAPVRLRKAIMRVGEFQTPDGARFAITRTRLDHWVRTFCKMLANGDVCRIVKDHQEDVGSSIGRVTAMERRGDYLYATLEFPTREMADLTLANDVSIFSQPNYSTGCGTYRDAIKHVSLTPFPLITQLGGYKRLGANAPLVCSINNIVKGSKAMDESLSKVLDMIAQFLGMEPPEEARSTNEAAISWLAAMFQAAGQAKGGEPAPASDEPPVDGTDADEDKDDEKLPEGADAIIASVNSARKSVLNGFVGYPGISAQQVGNWIKKYANCKSFKRQVKTSEAYDSLVEGLRCSINGKTNVLPGSSNRQYPGANDKIEIPGFAKLMALRK